MIENVKFILILLVNFGLLVYTSNEFSYPEQPRSAYLRQLTSGADSVICMQK